MAVIRSNVETRWGKKQDPEYNGDPDRYAPSYVKLLDMLKQGIGHWISILDPVHRVAEGY